MGRRALSWFLRSLARHRGLKPIKWQVISSPFLSSILRHSKVDISLRHITKLCQAFVVFTKFEDLFIQWLQSASTQPLNKVIQPVSPLSPTQHTYSLFCPYNGSLIGKAI